MPPAIIPPYRLSSGVLNAVIEEFITRHGTDYGHTEVPHDTKIEQVKSQLASGMAVLVYDDETETCNIFSVNDLFEHTFKLLKNKKVAE